MTVSDDPQPGAVHRLCSCLILLAVALAGIAHVAFLPPFEGFDEPAHWSYIQQIADTGSIPRPGAARISADIDAYRGPRPFDGQMPEQATAGLAFRAFFSGPTPRLSDPVARSYRPGRGSNYEAQHPPLYYALLTPAYLLAKSWSWPDHMLLLRLVSWGIAFAGFAIGCRVTQRALLDLQVPATVGLLVPGWPLLFPEFFPEMARLGNDSLCLLLMGIAWALILRALRTPGPKAAAWLGLVFGLGLLTKAFFWPILAGTVALFALAAAQSRDLRRLRDAAITLFVAAAVGGGWYVHNFATAGSFTGANDFVDLNGQDGLWQALRDGFGLRQAMHLLRGVAVTAASFAWAGTWSRALLSPIFTAPVVLLAVLPLGAWLLHFRRWPIQGQAPLFLVTPFLLGLLYHQVVMVATQPAGWAGTPGWYLHILCAPLALALALGWRHWRLFGALAAYAIAFHLVCWITQLSFFSGCAYKPGPRLPLRLDPGSCLIDPMHLAELGAPVLGAASLTVAIAAGAAAVFLMVRRPRRATAIGLMLLPLLATMSVPSSYVAA